MNINLMQIIQKFFYNYVRDGIERVNLIDRIKIDHYSWPENSIYRYLTKEVINNEIMRQVEIVVENEFLRWDDEYSKCFMIEGLSLIRRDKDLPISDAWEDIHTFESVAIKSLQEIIKDHSDMEITDIIYNVECQLQEAKKLNKIQLMQIYERILYELNECSLREFYELKKATLSEDR